MDAQDWSEWVELALQDAELGAMRPVVEKELLHYEIFYALDRSHLLDTITFQGGTSLRLCRGADRFSEDLDFAGGKDFRHEQMQALSECLIHHVGEKFGLHITVKEPKEAPPSEPILVGRWVVSIQTAPENRAMPHQRIKLEITNVPAYSRELRPLQLNYPSLIGLPQVLVNTESIDELLADKLIALPTSVCTVSPSGRTQLTPGRIRHRDIWDLAWLKGKGARLKPDWVMDKIQDYGLHQYPLCLQRTLQEVETIAHSSAFFNQMKRFVPSSAFQRTVGRPDHLRFMARSVAEELAAVADVLAGHQG